MACRDYHRLKLLVRLHQRFLIASLMFLGLSACDADRAIPNLDDQFPSFNEARQQESILFRPVEEMFSPGPALQLALAVEDGDIGTLEQLVREGTDVDIKGYKGVTPLFWAFRTGELDSFQGLLKLGADANATADGMGLIHLVTSYGRDDFLKPLLDSGADPNLCEAGDLPMTPLEYAIPTGQQNTKLKSLKLLIEAGADVNRTCGSTATPLVKAVSQIRYEVATYLLEQGADPLVFAKRRHGLSAYLEHHDELLLPDAKQRFWMAKFIDSLEEAGHSIDSLSSIRSREM